MISKKKKVFILCGMIALLVATGVLNVVLNNRAQASQTGAGYESYSDFFEGYRADRLATRNQSVEYLDAIIASASSSAEAKEQAESKKLELVSEMTQELALETLIRSQGYEDCIVTLGTEYVNCIVRTPQQLEEDQVAQILTTLVEETGRPATCVKITEVA